MLLCLLGGGKEGGNSDCGYSSSVEGSEPSSQDGSESCLHGETIGMSMNCRVQEGNIVVCKCDCLCQSDLEFLEKFECLRGSVGDLPRKAKYYA